MSDNRHKIGQVTPWGWIKIVAVLLLPLPVLALIAAYKAAKGDLKW